MSGATPLMLITWNDKSLGIVKTEAHILYIYHCQYLQKPYDYLFTKRLNMLEGWFLALEIAAIQAKGTLTGLFSPQELSAVSEFFWTTFVKSPEKKKMASGAWGLFWQNLRYRCCTANQIQHHGEHLQTDSTSEKSEFGRTCLQDLIGFYKLSTMW